MSWHVGAVIALTLALRGAAAAQSEIEVRREPCPDCEIELRRTAVINDSGIPVKFGDRVQLFRARDRYFVVSDVDPGTVAVFDTAGQYKGVFGRLGAGPNEFRFVVDVGFGRGDSLLVYDYGLRRIAVMAATDEGFQFVRTFPAPLGAREILPASDGRIVAIGALLTASSAGYPLHLFTAEGEFIRSFGSASPMLIPGESHLLRRRVTNVRGGSYWTAHVFRYILEHWNSLGKLELRLRAEAPWLDSEAAPSPAPFQVGPSTSIAGLGTAGDGRLWVIGRARDPGWRQAVRDPGNRGPIAADEFDALYDTVVELIDTGAGRVIAQHRIDRYLNTVARSALLYDLRVTGNHVSIVILQPVIQGSG